MKIKTIILIILISSLFLIASCGPDYSFLDTPKDLLGNPDAKIKIIEYSDLECPACRLAHPITKQVIDKYGEYVSLEYNHFPLSMHEHANLAAQAADCANDQGKFWEFIDDSYRFQEQLEKNDLIDRAEKLGLDIDSFKSCLNSGAKEDFVEADMREGINKGVRATPTFFVGGKILSNHGLDTFSEEIEDAMDRYGING